MIRILERVSPVIAFHGTTDMFLREILKKGMVPNPKNRVWGEDPQASVGQVSRASLYGTYWTTNLMTAISSASNATRKSGGNSIIVIASIIPESGAADEDDIRFRFQYAVEASINDLIGGIRLYEPTSLGRLWGMFKADPGVIDGIIEDVALALHKKFAKDKNAKPIPYDDISSIVLTYLKRQAIFAVDEKKSSSIMDWKRSFIDVYSRFSSSADKDRFTYDNTPLPSELFGYSKKEIEARLKKAEDRLTRYYKEIASRSIRGEEIIGGNVRITEPVTYSGRNRIIGIVRLVPGEDYQRLIEVVYGEVPQEFVTKYEQRVGELVWV